MLSSVDAPLGRVVYASDAAGAALLHGRTELVRRSFPSGEILRTRPLESEVIDLDSHDRVLHALCADGNLVSLDATDGTVLHRRPLPLYRPLCVYAAPDGTILVGTTAGQILRYPMIRRQDRTADE
ncbi:hypothetical protein [Streptomyces sp. NPDC048560]|uniref:hypothetical protein n=1 Tax=Streptomyces sp. NPDC048560 TaxID=3155488 RepID=UPI0034311B47